MTDTTTATDISTVLTPILQAAGIAAATLITAAVGYLVKKMGDKLGPEAQAQVAKNMDDMAAKAISAGVMASQDLIREKGWDHPQVQNEIVRVGANYAIAKFSDTIKAAGVDPASTVGAENIRALITRALPAGTAAAEASPTTPPAVSVTAAPVVVIKDPAP